MLELGLQLPVPRDVVEDHGRADPGRVGRGERDHLHVEPQQLGGRPLPAHVAHPHRAALGGRLLDGGPQLDGPVRHLEVLERPADVARAEAEEPVGAPVGRHERAVGPQHGLRRRRRVQRLVPQPDGGRVQVRRHRAAERVARRPPLRRGAADLAEEAPLELERLEQVRVREQHLGLAEEQHAARLEREVQAPHHVRLRLGVEVHERVAAQQQVDVRDRRVLHEVVAAEDHRAAQVLAVDVLVADPLEVRAQAALVEAIDLPLGVGGRACDLQGALVGVGRVDLHPVAEGDRSEGVAQLHGERVGLLTGRATRAPRPHRPVAADHPGQDVLAQVLPGVRVAQEARDVDEDRVEQRGVLAGLRRQTVLVVLEGVDAHDVHAVAHPPHEALPLVPGEVEAPLLLQVPQQRLELRVGCCVHVCSAPVPHGLARRVTA